MSKNYDASKDPVLKRFNWFMGGSIFSFILLFFISVITNAWHFTEPAFYIPCDYADAIISLTPDNT